MKPSQTKCLSLALRAFILVLLVSMGHANILNPPPIIINCPDSLMFDHCSQAVFEFHAVDTQFIPPSFVVLKGPGAFVAGCKFWVYNPTPADAKTTQQLVIAAVDGASKEIGPPDTVNLIFTNIPPLITKECGNITYVAFGDSASVEVRGESQDCDPVIYRVSNITPTPAGSFHIDKVYGELVFSPAKEDRGKRFEFTVCAADFADSSCCACIFEVFDIQPFQIRIDTTHDSYQGMRERVKVILEMGNQNFDGFDLCIAFDNRALFGETPIPGTAIFAEPPAGCGWKQFRHEWIKGEDVGLTPGQSVLHVTGNAIAENGKKAKCRLPNLPAALFTMEFLVTDNRTYSDRFIPLRFIWLDSNSNRITLRDGRRMPILSRVFDEKHEQEICDSASGFPLYGRYNTPGSTLADIQMNKGLLVDYVNGGVRITGPGYIDNGGDLNLNEISFEAADAELFVQYFMFGEKVFTLNLQGSIASSDLNKDGKTLTVADLVYMERITEGNAHPIKLPIPCYPATLSRKGDILNVNRPIGAALIHALGDVKPEALNPGAELSYNFDGVVTRILVHSFPSDTGRKLFGDFVRIPAPIVYTELATFEGYKVDVSYSCCSGMRGDANGDGAFLPTIDDAKAIGDFLSGTSRSGCDIEADVNGDGAITISDVAYLIAYLYTKGPAPVSCP